MDEKENEKTSIKKVFFITSNQSKLDESIKYSLVSKKGVANLKKIMDSIISYNREKFTRSVYTFDIVPKELEEKNKDSITKKYKTDIALKFKKSFNGKIYFKENINNFIYNFEFAPYKSWTGYISPPISIKFTNTEQLKIYKEVLRMLNVKQQDELSLNLVTESQTYIIGQNFFFRFLFRSSKIMLYSKRS